MKDERIEDNNARVEAATDAEENPEATLAMTIAYAEATARLGKAALSQFEKKINDYDSAINLQNESLHRLSSAADAVRQEGGVWRDISTYDKSFPFVVRMGWFDDVGSFRQVDGFWANRHTLPADDFDMPESWLEASTDEWGGEYWLKEGFYTDSFHQDNCWKIDPTYWTPRHEPPTLPTAPGQPTKGD